MKYTTEEFIKRAKEVHDNKYDYSKANYVGTHKKILIICPTHGEFWQDAANHLRGHGCPACGNVNRPTAENFIKRAKEIHGNKYDYSLVEYKNMTTKIKIICPLHGVFEQTPANHTNRSGPRGCPKCGNDKVSKKLSIGKGEFIKRAKEIHGDKYDYSLVEYKNNETKVKIICPIHGVFEQTPNGHLAGGCAACSGIKKYTTEEFIKRAKEVHGDKYDYSLVNYVNAHTKIKIVCPKHGMFFAIPANHLNRGDGCPYCKSTIGEEKIRVFLENKGYVFNKDFFKEKSFNDLKDSAKLRYDFYIPSKRLLIEYDGYQHYVFPNRCHETYLDFLKQKHHDWLKRKYAKKHNLKLERILYNENIKSRLKEILK